MHVNDATSADEEEGELVQRQAAAPRLLRWPPRRHRSLWVVVAILVIAAGAGTAAAVMATGGPAAGTWFIPSSPKLEVSVRAGCPASIGGYRDVVNTFRGPPVVPADPTVGLICRYGPGVGLGPDGGGRGLLMNSTRLEEAQARQLASVIRDINLAAPSGTVACPADFGSVALLGFRYAGRPDVGLWWTTSGCETLDNGRIGAWEVGNPSFYNAFEGAIDGLSPHPDDGSP